MQYEIIYYEDEFTSVARVIVECNNESEVKEMADSYYEENLSYLDIAGAKWYKIDN